MKRVGIVGGLGPESTVDYYQSIIAKYQERMQSKEVLPEMFINSINMYQVFEFINNKQLDGLTNYLVDAVKKLDAVGSDFAIISANTPHIVFEEVQKQIPIPMISIVEATYNKTLEFGLKNIGLIGTKYTMENDFFKSPFTSRNKKVTVPTESEQQYIHGKIVAELENGIVNNETKINYLNIIKRMKEEEGIEGVILGCTELPMIIKGEDLDIPVFNTTEIHVNRIVDTIFR
ncbi:MULTISPECIES: aspartate/glutamate racemase family protein [Paraliobacillus]|uniref:aspartate/glutamate racemase family protein n=1 Tax=Paraliobacillus TaxID=200903 RepID=UPI000DD49C63|nr:MULTISPECIES: amino acid racemase [Paraliobacillus]